MIYRLRYAIVDADNADWEEYFYHDVVKVTKGIAITSDPTTLVALQGAGFELFETIDDDGESTPCSEDAQPLTRRRTRS